MPDKIDLRFGSNDVRLGPREWVVALALILAVIGLAPVVWPFLEPLRLEPDHRLPFSLGNDYYTYARLCRAAAARGKTLLVGDSVVWGHYVPKEEALSAQLNKLSGAERYANLGVDGIHPAAMLGLLEHHGHAIRRRAVVLHCNLLWMSSRRHDLSADKEFAFNHPTLVPQFSPRIPCYKESFADRLGIAIERGMPFHAWKKHLQFAYFGGDDLPAWTMHHPYNCPLRAVTLRLPSPNEEPSPKPDTRPWTAQGIARQGFAWVDLDASLQWRFFRETADLLLRRGNRLFVLVGPFNEHMVKPDSLAAYQARKRAVGAWLAERGIPHLVAEPLPSELYADASHPLADGYRLLAGRLLECAAFRHFGQASP